MKIKLKNPILGFGLFAIGGFFGAWAGADNTSLAWRRIFIPLLLIAIAIYSLRPTTIYEWIMIICLMSMAGGFAQGYGIPSPDSQIGQPNYDEGSRIGRFWYKTVFGGIQNETKRHFLADICTRGTVGVFICLSLLFVAFLKKNWGIYGLCSVGILASYSLLSWRNLGTVEVRGKELLIVDLIHYGIVTLLSGLVILK